MKWKNISRDISYFADETEIQQLLLLVPQVFTSETRFNAQITQT